MYLERDRIVHCTMELNVPQYLASDSDVDRHVRGDVDERRQREKRLQDRALDEVDRKAPAYAEEHGCDYEAALDAVLERHPNLKAAYTDDPVSTASRTISRGAGPHTAFGRRFAACAGLWVMCGLVRKIACKLLIVKDIWWSRGDSNP